MSSRLRLIGLWFGTRFILAGVAAITASDDVDANDDEDHDAATDADDNDASGADKGGCCC